MGERTERLLNGLKIYCDAEYGRRGADLVRCLGVSVQKATDLLDGRVQSTVEQALAMLEYLQNHEK
jgi:hypothetical protein